MSLTERIYGKETAGKPAVSSDTQKNLYTAAANKKPSLANRIAQNGGQPTLYADAAAKQKPSLASRIEANGGTPYADAAAQMKSGNAAKGTSVVFNSVYGKADDRASSAGSGKYADILKASDYTELSKSGESKRKLFGDARYDYINNIGNFRAQSDVQQAQGRGQDYGKYAFMTDDEIGVYNYLYAKQGKKAANAYLSDLEPELDKQWYTGTNRETTEALGKNAATRTLASAMTVAAQPTRTITSMIAMADDAVRTAKGQEINPYSKWRQASNITQDLRADTSQHIEETNPGMGGKVGSFVYNTAMSAADSAMNALVAKGIGEAVGLTGDTLMKATNILGSALMSSEAASLSIAESKEKGYSNAGALALGLTRGAIEYASEAVGGEWVIRKIKANPLSFVKSMALTMIPEGMEEVMSDAANGVVNLAIDAAFGTEESGIPKMLEYYRTSGTDWQKKHAELATVLAVLGQEGLSFLGGALATLGSSSVQYSTNRANINQTAERLDTTPKNVVQMMQDAQTENPGVIYALAELTDAENADDLRQKIGTKEDMKRAAEYLTQQMEAGGRSGTQEGTYTAGAQNAPVGAQRAQNEGIGTTPAAAINIQEGMNNGQSTYQGRENGSYDLRTGGQAAAEGGTQALAGGRAEIPGGVGADAQADLRQVTPAQLGIRNGGTEAVTVVDARKLGGDAARAYNLLAANNIEPVAVRGAIQVNNGYANAYTESGRVFFRVDAVDSRGNAISPEALVRHELFHNYISEEVLQASDEVIRESMTAEEYDAMYESYRDAYASIYDFENMSEDEIERLLTEEIAADAYAGLNWFSGDAPVQEAVRAETERNAPARRAEAQQETTGPPEGRGTIVVLPDGKKYVKADRQVIFGDDPDSWADQIEGYINRKIRNGEDVILTTDSGDVLKITEDTAGKASFRNYVRDENGTMRRMTDAEYEAKLNAEAHIDELAQISERINKKPRKDETARNGQPIHGELARNGWIYRKAEFQDFDGQRYRVTISTPDGNNGVVVYNVGKMQRRGSPAIEYGSSDSVTETGAQQGKSSSTATIRQTEGNSQEKSSGKASVEVENRNADNENASSDNENRDSDNKKQGRKKLSEAEKYQNTTSKMAENRTIRNVAEYEKQISRMEKRLETGGQATLNEGGGNFYRVNIREENGEYYAYISDGKNVVGKHKSKAKMEAIRWAGDRMRAEIASRILYNPDTKLRGSYQSDLKSAKNKEYPVFKTKSGTEMQTVPFWTWVQDKSGHYGLVVGQDINGAVRAWFPFGGDGTGTVVTAANTTLYAVEGDYESRAWNNEIVAEALDDAEESAAARNARKDKMRESQENDRREAERLRARENLGAGQRFVPNKSSGEVYRELMGKGKSEVKVQMTGFLKGTPRDSTFKIEVKPTPIGGYFEATIFHDGHKADTLVRALKETAARDAAEEVITMANKNFSEENYQRAKKFEAEKTADEDARIAELFGDTEQLDSTEPSPKSSDAAETENTAAGTTIAATTEKVTSEVIKAERNYREDFEKITSGAMRMFVNAGDTVRRIAKATGSKSLEGYYFNAGAYSQRAGNWIAKGGARTDIDGHRIGASLADTLAPMRKNETKYRDFQLYLLHMHNVDRMKYDNSGELERIKENLRWVKEKYPELRELSNEELRRIANSDSDSPVVRQAAHEIYLAAHNGEAPSLTSVAEGAAYALELERQRDIVEKQGLKPVFGYDVTADDSQTAAQLLEAKNPEFKEWAKEVYKYSDDLIRYRVEAGLITPEFANALKKRYPHYIPTFREEGTNSKRARSARRNGGIVVSNAIGRAVGSDGVLLPLHTALSRKTVSTMRNAGLNQFGLALVREYDGNAKAAEKYIWNVAESEYTPTEAAIESDEDYKPVFENVFSVKDNGKAYDITMDEGLTAAMKAFEPDRFASYGAAKAMKKLNDLFKALCTGYNPFFMIRNGVRDWQDAGFYSTDWKTWEKMYWSAWNQIRKNGEIWQQYKALGGSYASMLDYTTGMVKEPKNALGKAAARYESFGQAIEAAPRLAEFMTILANKGGSKTVDGVKTGKFTQSDLMEAMLGAADITTNFARGGSVTKALNRYLVPFLNPSIQGFDKFIRNATETRSVKAAASLILKAALINLPPLLLNGLMHGDDDDWDDIPASTKANYYLINAGKLFGNGYWIKIPKGRAIAVLSTAAVYTQEKQKGEDVKFSDVFEVIKSNIAPTDIFNQNIATAWTQAKLTNPDNPGTTWYGGNIESDRLQNYRPEDRYDEKTDELSKDIGKLFKVSPKKVNYLLDQYSGVIGDILLPLMTPATSAKSKLLAAPMAAFTIDTTSTNKTTGEYYDLLDELKYDANDGDIGAGITRKYVSHAGDEVNDYYQQIRAIQNDKSLSDGEKNRLVRALKAQLIERQKEIIAQAEPYREAVNDYLKAHPELSTDNDAAIAEYAEQYEITEDQAESRMDAIVYREANREVFGAEYALRTYNADVYDKARAAYAKGVSYDTYYDYYFATKEMHADKDENGKSISGSKKAKVVEFINSLDIPPEQKDALYVAAGYTARSARNQKWNGGSGGSGGRRGRGKRTALKAPTPKAPEIIIPRSGTASSAKAGGTSKTPKVRGNVIADFTKTASGTDIQKAVTQAKRKALKAGNRTVYVEEGSPIDYFLKYGKLPSLK